MKMTIKLYLGTNEGDMIYYSPVDQSWHLLSGNTDNLRRFLGYQSISGAYQDPAWDTLIAADIPNLPASIITSGDLASGRMSANILAAIIAAGGIVDADVAIAAALTPSKIKPGTLGQYMQVLAGPTTGWGPPPTAGSVGLVYSNVLAAAAQDIDISGLNINGDRTYMLLLNLKNNLTSGNWVDLFIDGDYTESHYSGEYLSASGTTVSATRQARPAIAYLDASITISVEQKIWLGVDGYSRFVGLSTKDATGTTIVFENYAGEMTVPESNITSLRIHGANASQFAAGSIISLYKFGGF